MMTVNFDIDKIFTNSAAILEDFCKQKLPNIRLCCIKETPYVLDYQAHSDNHGDFFHLGIFVGTLYQKQQAYTERIDAKFKQGSN